MKSKQDLFTLESEGQAKFSGSQRSMWDTTKRSGKAAEPAVVLHMWHFGVQAYVPALMLL